MIFIIEVLRARSQAEIDIYGLLGLFMVFVVGIMSLLAPVEFVTHDMDPWTLSLIALSSPQLNILPPIYNVIGVKIIVYFLALGPIYTVFIIAKTLLLAIMPFAQLIIQLNRYFLRTQFTYRKQFQIRLFTQVHISMRMIYSLTKNFTGMYLGFAYYAGLLGLNSAVFGWRILPFNVYFIVPIFCVIWFASLAFLFSLGCGFYEGSVDVLISWRKQVVRMSKPKEMIRVLRSLQPVMLPVGEVGMMDREIKMNYGKSLLDAVMNSSIVIHDLMSA